MKRALYKIVNRKNGKYYVGSTIRYKTRQTTHIRELRNGVHHSIILQRAFNKYGEESFYFEVIKYFNDDVTEETIREEEQKILHECLPSYNVSRCASGGDLLSYHPNKEDIIKRRSKTLLKNLANRTPEEKKKSQERYLGEKNPNYKNAIKKCPICGINVSYRDVKSCMDCRDRHGEKNSFYGKSHSEETKRRISEANVGRLPQNMRPVLVDDKKYESVTSASRDIGVTPSTIINRIRNKKFLNYKYI